MPVLGLLLSLVTLASASDDFSTLLTEAKGSLVAGDYKAARDLLNQAEAAAPTASTRISQTDVARLYFYRGVLYWRASPESAALDNWRQALTVAPQFQPETDLLPDQSERDTFLALGAEVQARGQVPVKIPEDTGEAVVYIDGQQLDPGDSVAPGSHLIQVKCDGGELHGEWHAYGAPPADYLAVCGGSGHSSARSSTSSSASHSSSSSHSSSTSSSASKSTASRSTKPAEDLDEAPARDQKKSGGNETVKNVAGISLMGLGVAGGVVSVFAYEQVAQANEAYTHKSAAAEINPKLLAARNNYYDTVLIPSYQRFYAVAIGSGVFLAGGATLVLLGVEGPGIAPLPGGGGMLSWSGHF
jgi:tetratricopeptide (TPR) repeat protein